MKTYADKTHENRSHSAANAFSHKQNGSDPSFQLVDNRPAAIAQRKLQKTMNNSPQAKQTAQLKMTSVIQRITEEDMNQAVINIRPAATAHGYSREMLEPIIQHRFAEIRPGNGNMIVLGKGADESNPYFGRLVYDCRLMRNGSYYINVFHAHGGQTESASPRGY